LPVAADRAAHGVRAERLDVDPPAARLAARRGAAARLEGGAFGSVQRPHVGAAGPGGEDRDVALDKIE